ncbi:hypothetical protein ACFYRC_15990 [Streptomyces sp. NPDC005279]|uniref:hypothetical protein n=1 Tax=Streptomyces sp. NPDC005279 TaxID=3364712 RepID=UPI0036854AC5
MCLNRSERWTESLSSALLGDWVAPLYDGTGLGRPALDRLRSEARTLHTQLVPLWKRRPGKNRVLPLETPVRNGTTLRDLLADRSLPDDPVLDQVPGDRRLAAILAALNPADRAVDLARGHCGVATRAEAAPLTGSERPDEDGERVRRTVRRAVAELRAATDSAPTGPPACGLRPRTADSRDRVLISAGVECLGALAATGLITLGAWAVKVIRGRRVPLPTALVLASSVTVEVFVDAEAEPPSIDVLRIDWRPCLRPTPPGSEPMLAPSGPVWALHSERGRAGLKGHD